MTDPTRRFSGRVRDYDRWRPGYPRGILDRIAGEGLLPPGVVVADVGAGTGRLTRLLLDRGARVIAVEPNAEMRAACERRLGGREGFRAVDGRAEATGLDDGCVDLVTAAQAAHWFDLEASRREFRRILRPGGSVALIWNLRRSGATPFMAAYEALLREHGTDYERVAHDGLDRASLDRFFGAGRYGSGSLPNRQVLDREGLRGRVLSASYVPAPGEDGHEALIAALDALFDAHARDGLVRLDYDTCLHLGALHSEAGSMPK